MRVVIGGTQREIKTSRCESTTNPAYDGKREGERESAEMCARGDRKDRASTIRTRFVLESTIPCLPRRTTAKHVVLDSLLHKHKPTHTLQTMRERERERERGCDLTLQRQKAHTETTRACCCRAQTEHSAEKRRKTTKNKNK